MPKLTKRTIDATEPQATEFFLWDEGIPSVRHLTQDSQRLQGVSYSSHETF